MLNPIPNTPAINKKREVRDRAGMVGALCCPCYVEGWKPGTGNVLEMHTVSKRT